MPPWTRDDIPDQAGRTVIVTGANTGIGFETALALAQKGARVVLACRNAEKGQEAVARIAAERPAGTAELAALDLSDLDSVAAFADSFLAANDRLDLLVNNAGVMVPPFGRTKQGFETQLGTNHLGHFSLAARLLPLVRRTPGARVVVVSSSVHHAGSIHFDDLNYARRRYRAFAAYCQSKLANLLFAKELRERLAQGGGDTRVTAAHPGWTATDLQRTMGVARLFNPLLAMTVKDGCLPTLRAATDPAADSGSYWGPSRLFELNGPPAPAFVNAKAKDAAVAARLWSVSEELTGVRFDMGA